VADGRLGAAMNQTTRIWDIAAAVLILKEAGGVVTDLEGNEIRFDLSAASFGRNYAILASGAGLHLPLMEIVNAT
jgi:fructose-1,6-bisphosphatase/inositol monophosphatase family enzyme